MHMLYQSKNWVLGIITERTAYLSIEINDFYPILYDSLTFKVSMK